MVKNIKLSTISIIMGIGLSACTSTYDVTTNNNETRFYSIEKQQDNLNIQKFEEKPIVQRKNKVYSGSFYATVKQVSQLNGVYQILIEGEKGSLVTLTTPKLVYPNEKILFVHEGDVGVIFKSNEREFQNIVPTVRNPK